MLCFYFLWNPRSWQIHKDRKRVRKNVPSVDGKRNELLVSQSEENAPNWLTTVLPSEHAKTTQFYTLHLTCLIAAKKFTLEKSLSIWWVSIWKATRTVPGIWKALYIYSYFLIFPAVRRNHSWELSLGRRQNLSLVWEERDITHHTSDTNSPIHALTPACLIRTWNPECSKGSA